jgi:hypothetical protein
MEVGIWSGAAAVGSVEINKINKLEVKDWTRREAR